MLCCENLEALTVDPIDIAGGKTIVEISDNGEDPDAFGTTFPKMMQLAQPMKINWNKTNSVPFGNN